MLVFWVPTYSLEAFEQAYGEIARQLELHITLDIKEDIKDSVRRYLSSPSASKWMLIVDNADDLDLLLSVEKVDNLFQHLPKSSLGLTVYTTRSRRVAQSVVGSNIVELAKMDDQDAMALLKRLLV